MKPIITIDVSDFDCPNQIRVEYALSSSQFLDPVSTLVELAKDPSAFLRNEGEYRLVLTQSQNQRLLRYLNQGGYFRESFGDPRRADYVLAFSFGENPDVNMELASIVRGIEEAWDGTAIAVQWEIADILCDQDPTFAHRICRIELDPGQDYLTTAEIVDRFLKGPYDPEKDSGNLCVVAQSWHAPRCILLCSARGLKVTSGRFSNRFSPNDPQSWVRNAFSWILKEGTKPDTAANKR